MHFHLKVQLPSALHDRCTIDIGLSVNYIQFFSCRKLHCPYFFLYLLKGDVLRDWYQEQMQESRLKCNQLIRSLEGLINALYVLLFSILVILRVRHLMSV